MVNKVKDEIREEAMILNGSGYKIKLLQKRVGGVLCLRLFINNTAVCVSCETGVFGNLINIRNSLSAIERFVTEVV